MQKLDLGVEYNPDLPQENVTDFAAPAASQATQSQSSPQAQQYQSTHSHSSMSRSNSKFPIIIAVIAIVAGIFTGFGTYRLQTQAGTVPGLNNGEPIQQIADDSAKAGDIFGSADEAAFKDSAQGYLEIGGLNGEGSHKLKRAGGESQTVYLVSTVTDLDKFDGMTIKVWGETYKGQKAGWLMDVGRVQVVDVKGAAPSED